MFLLSRIFVIYIMAAILPALLLLVYIYNQDTVDKEPPHLLLNLLLMGVVAGLASIVLEQIGTSVLNSFVSPENPVYVVFLAFLVVAVVEEGTKFFLLYRKTWRNPNFNYRFDAIVYAVFVSLGFAAFENIGYVFGYGLTVAPARALLAIPGHMSFAVFMGYFYGRSKLFFDYGDKVKSRQNLWLAYLSAVFLHGFYDSCAMIGSAGSTIVFVVFIILMYLAVYRMIKNESHTDAPV